MILGRYLVGPKNLNFSFYYGDIDNQFVLYYACKIGKSYQFPNFLQSQFQINFLTVASLFDRFLPKGSFSLISMISYHHLRLPYKNYSQGLPLKFQGSNFGAIKIPGNKILIGRLTGSEPDMTISDRISN